MAHTGSQGELSRLSRSAQAFVHGFDRGIVPAGDQRRHVQRPPEMGVALLGQMTLAAHRCTGEAMTGRQARVGGELLGRMGHQGELSVGQHTNRTLTSHPGNGTQHGDPAAQLGIPLTQCVDGLFEAHQLAVRRTAAG